MVKAPIDATTGRHRQVRDASCHVVLMLDTATSVLQKRPQTRPHAQDGEPLCGWRRKMDSSICRTLASLIPGNAVQIHMNQPSEHSLIQVNHQRNQQCEEASLTYHDGRKRWLQHDWWSTQETSQHQWKKSNNIQSAATTTQQFSLHIILLVCISALSWSFVGSVDRLDKGAFQQCNTYGCLFSSLRPLGRLTLPQQQSAFGIPGNEDGLPVA